MAKCLGVGELSGALQALAFAASELGTAASAVASAATALAEDISNPTGGEENPPVSEILAAEHMLLNIELPGYPMSLPCKHFFDNDNDPGEADSEEDSEEERFIPIWEPCEMSRAMPIKQIQPCSVTTYGKSLHFRVVWDAKKAANVQRKDGTPVTSVAALLADRIEVKAGWTVHCGPKEWELMMSVPQSDCSNVDIMREDIARLVKDMVGAELESSEGNGGRNIIGCVRVREVDEVTDRTPQSEVDKAGVKEEQLLPPVVTRHELFSVKNTFVHVNEPPSPSRSIFMRRRMSAPVSMLVRANALLSHA